MKRSVLALLLSLAYALSTSALDTIFLVRHAEKENDWPKQRELDALHPLSAAGVARAESLAGYFAELPVLAIYTSATTRALQSGLPLARRLGIELSAAPESSDAALLGDFLAKLEVAHPGPGAVVVIGHSNTIPLLLRALGASEECDAALGIAAQSFGPGIDGYAGIWRASLGQSGCAAFTRFELAAPAP